MTYPKHKLSEAIVRFGIANVVKWQAADITVGRAHAQKMHPDSIDFFKLIYE